MKELSQDNTNWLIEFFSDPNQLIWSDILAKTAQKSLVNHVELMLEIDKNGELLSPVILPYVKNGKIESWYSTAQDPTELHHLDRQLRSWLGPSYLKEIERIDPKSTEVNYPMANAMEKCFGCGVIRFFGPNDQIQKMILSRLNTYKELLKRCPQNIEASFRAYNTLKSEFDQAILVQDEETAEKLIKDLKCTGRLTYENQLFIEVRFFAGLKKFSEISRNAELIRSLSDFKLPPIVLSDLLESLFQTFLSDLERKGDVDVLVNEFSKRIAAHFPWLFKNRMGISTQYVVKSFLLFEKIQHNSNYDTMKELLSLISENDPFIDLYKKITEISPKDKKKNLLEEAKILMEKQEFDRAFNLFLSLPLDQFNLQKLIECNFYIDDADFSRKLVEKIDSEPKEFSKIPSKIKSGITKIREIASAAEFDIFVSEIKNWIDWANLLVEGNVDLAKKAIENCVTWNSEIFHQDELKSKEFADKIGNLNDDSENYLRQSLPTIVQQIFENDNIEIREASKVLAITIFDILSISGEYGKNKLHVISLMLDIIFELGVEEVEYLSILESLLEIQEMVISPENFSWCLDICEKFAITPSPGKRAMERRGDFYKSFVNRSHSFRHRIEVHNFNLIEELRLDFGESEELINSLKPSDNTERDVDLEPTDLSGKKIGIYTLSDSAGKRAKNALEKTFPGVSVTVNSDKAATDQLTSLAKHSNLFVFAWRSSSHQAFNCVKNAIHKENLLYAAGKGTSSILQAIKEKLT